MRIAMVGVRGIPARVGGAEHVAEELTRELSARGHEVIVYGRRAYLAGAGAPAAGRSIVTPGLAGKHLEAITHTATAMLDVLGRKVDVVHVHSVGPALLSWMPALCGKPVVLTIHAPDWQRDKWSPGAKRALRAGLAMGMRFADEVATVSGPLARELSARWGRDVTYVPNGVRPVSPRPPDAIRRWGLNRNGYALYVGRIVEEKRLGLLLDAWPRIACGCPLVVVGDARATAYGRACLRKAFPAKTPKAAGALFIGPQFDNVLAELYTNATVLVHPSVVEGMSLVLLEAASHGCCIVAADIPANREVLGETALYFRADDASELCRQVCRSVGDEALRAGLGRGAQALVTARYSWPHAAEQIEGLYRRAVARKRHGT